MVKKIRILCCFSCFILLSSGFNSVAQCDSEAFLDKCAAKLKEYTFLKAYKINAKDSKKGKAIEYSYVCSKNTNYYIAVCSNGNNSKMIVNLYNKDRQLLATSFDKRTLKHYPALIYRCTSTGIYYLSFDFDSKDGCGVSVLGFDGGD